MIAPRLIEWQRRHGRNDLPWQGTREAYRIWLSEVMLQQTQVGTVLPYYLRFVERFPDLSTLAAADLDEVLALWSGLGYYGRARNLHRCARELMVCHEGRFPDDVRALQALPGIGRSSAAAIAVFAFGRRAAILDGNVRRVLCRHAGVHGDPRQRAIERRLWQIAERELPQARIEAYTQGLMDLGATVCRRARPLCEACPLAADCSALRDGTPSALPTPRPRRAMPLRDRTLLVIRRGAEVLLERRAPSGIWGGLWSVPEREADGEDGAVGEIERRFGLRVAAAVALPRFEHAFTHFRLRAQPLLCEFVSARAACESAHLRWLALEDVGAAALPRPVKTLLALPALRSPAVAAGTGESGTSA